jgi:ribosomal protein L3 glutamine methyltransferase
LRIQSRLLSSQVPSQEPVPRAAIVETHESLARFKLLSKEAESSLHSLRDLIRFCSTRLTRSAAFFGHGTSDPYEEAIFLVAHATRLTPTILEPLADARLTPSEVREVLDLLNTRIQERIPAPYLANMAVLSDKTFYVDRRCLVPRSFIAELLQQRLSPHVSDPEAVTSVLDMCTGSGCLALLAADAFPNAAITAIDASVPALQVAERNVVEHGQQDRVQLIQSDMFAALRPKSAATMPPQFDVIISNPPYVKSSDMLRLPVEFQHEPKMALDGGDDGMHFVRALLKHSWSHLSENGVLVVEVGGLRQDIERAFPNLPFVWLSTSSSVDEVFLLRKSDFEQTSQQPTRVRQTESDLPFSDALNTIAQAQQTSDPMMAQAIQAMRSEQKRRGGR